VTDLWITNSSPVITLAKVGQLRLLDELAETILMPDAVAAEILAGPPLDEARVSVSAGWAQRASPIHIPQIVQEWGLGSGETNVLALALERAPATAVLDDASARAAARALNVPLIGTLGIVLRAKLRGLIPSAAKIIEDLRNADLFLDENVVRNALNQINKNPSR